VRKKFRLGRGKKHNHVINDQKEIRKRSTGGVKWMDYKRGEDKECGPNIDFRKGEALGGFQSHGGWGKRSLKT